MAIGIFSFLIAKSQRSHGGGLRHYVGLRNLAFVAIEGALHGIFRSYSQSLRVTLILNEVGLVISDFRAIVETAASSGGGMRHDGIQRLSQQFMVGGKLQLELSRGAKHGHAIGRREGSE